MALIAISDLNGLWTQLKADWQRECEQFDEDFANYAPGVFEVIEPLGCHGNPMVAEGQRRSGIFGVKALGDQIDAICQVNRAPIPGYTEPVIRVRFITFAPRYDFGDFEIEAYARVLVAILSGIIILSTDNDLKSRHIHFHLASPADRQFFAALQDTLSGLSIFETVTLKGSWLYVTKRG